MNIIISFRLHSILAFGLVNCQMDSPVKAEPVK